MNFGINNITEKGARLLLSALAELKNVTSIILNLSNNKIDEKEEE